MSVTDAQLQELRALPKRVTNPRARQTEKERHSERNYEVQGGDQHFLLYLRQSLLVTDGFSCGLVWLSPGASWTLTRYNGSDHPHGNTIEGTRADHVCHIHLLTERYIAAGRKPEHYAEPTDRFLSLNGALRCLLLDWNITGLTPPENDQPSLI